MADLRSATVVLDGDFPLGVLVKVVDDFGEVGTLDR